MESIYRSIFCESVRQPFGQSVSHSVSQSARQSISQSVIESVSQSVSQSASQPASQPVNQSVGLSVGWSVGHASQSINQPISLSLSPSINSFIHPGFLNTNPDISGIGGKPSHRYIVVFHASFIRCCGKSYSTPTGCLTSHLEHQLAVTVGPFEFE